MEARELLEQLLAATTVAEVEAALEDFETSHADDLAWVPVGGKDNNRGPIEVSADPGRSLVERITNGIDAVLEAEHERHGGIPETRSPQEAAQAWLGVPEGGLSALTPRQRQQLADRVTTTILTGDGRNSRLLAVRDRGIGIAPEDFGATILSLNESNKIQKHYLAGTYGQGGSSTFTISNYTLIASRRPGREVGFTVVKFLDLPPDLFKTGHYVYLTAGEQVLTADVPEEDFEPGTVARHYGYDLSTYPSPVGPASLYGLLNQVLFDPVVPIWLESEVHNYRRVIKGSRNALNGAVDEGDAERRGPTLAHHVPLFYVSLGDFGNIGFEYWVLERPTTGNRRPSASFINPTRPIIMTLNGQNHAELHNTIIKREAELPYLAPRFIGHVDCNSLTPAAKRALFASTREEARQGAVYQLIRDELLRVLRSDDELARLNNEAREDRAQERDETAMQEMRRQVAQLLRLHGLQVGQVTGPQAGDGDGRERPVRPRPPRRPLAPIEAQEPPTFIRLVWDDEPITFYPGQRRYVRVETDAASHYHHANDPGGSRTNFIVTGESVRMRGSTPLQGGRLRLIMESPENAAVGSEGQLRVELARPGLPTLSDERPLRIVEPPPARPGQRAITLPPFDVRPVAGPHEEQWAVLEWPDDASAVASSALMEEGVLVVYYSRVFPRFSQHLTRYEQRDPGQAASFTKRYEIWLATHSLLLQQDQETATETETTDASPEQELELLDAQERIERCRMATMACLFAARELEMGVGPHADVGEDS